ncbi:MAG: hypothetical protein A2729_02885 [Candidatus Buchananbacteria bacterium RIFCSPHIGHO2_01_FULL_39_14]|uniref:Uncharacterized protein n=2 Tax=Candidatus Buchananiibacteriota TaxID=1817903 RepID=A0A1G1YTH0_9BACT|nr:MAG: hypothetical protein A2729_02885 [Candidatus Buchananbacteria bacterium RIFCSPHIGHO2_01_FULL_39_14]OGY49429.1 MAG: hypothetical protein A3D39_02730 [Candidatus Buchananbacteria bacterium RIFCSPHIGHO2_02_FULL_39_17]OGY55648.1 MAG: hypothetical protein A2912_05575 [Candidatus Buchananbacteria bacterium RIFCSPLOWO2_01_FULL_40_23b]
MAGIICLVWLIFVTVVYIWRLNQVTSVTVGGFWFIVAFSPLVLGLVSIAFFWWSYLLGGEFSLIESVSWTMSLGLVAVGCFVINLINYAAVETDNQIT